MSKSIILSSNFYYSNYYFTNRFLNLVDLNNVTHFETPIGENSKINTLIIRNISDIKGISATKKYNFGKNVKIDRLIILNCQIPIKEFLDNLNFRGISEIVFITPNISYAEVDAYRKQMKTNFQKIAFCEDSQLDNLLNVDTV